MAFFHALHSHRGFYESLFPQKVQRILRHHAQTVYFEPADAKSKAASVGESILRRRNRRQGRL